MYRVVHIPEDEAVLLNSREKAPYLICVEVLKCETPSHTKASSDAQKLSSRGIPLANGDAQLPKPPPWAYPLWSKNDIYSYDADGMLKSTSQAIDQAMAKLWEAKVKFVDVSFSIESRLVDHSEASQEIDSEWKSQQATVNHENLAIKSTTSNHRTLEWISVNLSAVPGINMEDVEDQEPSRPKDHRRVPSTIAIEEVKVGLSKGTDSPWTSSERSWTGFAECGTKGDDFCFCFVILLEDLLSGVCNALLQVMNGRIPKPSDALSGELWEVKKERIRRSSTYGKSPGWDLRSVSNNLSSLYLVMKTARYRAVRPKIDRRQSISAIGGRLKGEIDRQQSIEGEIDCRWSIEREKGKKKKKRKRRKKEKRRRRIHSTRVRSSPLRLFSFFL
ncbi:hypothetical protein BHM03_00058484 [Ensete ventricosum]|nr:hypothetical protein BHM03_00058484 [Ensete ventricosum]